MSKIMTENQRKLLIALAQDERRAIYSRNTVYHTPEEGHQVADELSEAIEALKNLQVTA